MQLSKVKKNHLQIIDEIWVRLLKATAKFFLLVISKNIWSVNILIWLRVLSFSPKNSLMTDPNDEPNHRVLYKCFSLIINYRAGNLQAIKVYPKSTTTISASDFTRYEISYY